MTDTQPRDSDDWALVARARGGDVRAFETLVRRYQNPVIAFCYRMAGSYEDAEDLAQESFVRVYRALDRLTPRAQFTTFLFGVVRNLTLNHLRNGKRRGRDRSAPLGEEDQFLEDSAAGVQPDSAARLSETEDLLAEALEALSPEHKEVIVLRELQGMDYESIAEVTCCRKGTVKSRLARAREHLRKRLTELGVTLQ